MSTSRYRIDNCVFTVEGLSEAELGEAVEAAQKRAMANKGMWERLLGPLDWDETMIQPGSVVTGREAGASGGGGGGPSPVPMQGAGGDGAGRLVSSPQLENGVPEVLAGWSGEAAPSKKQPEGARAAGGGVGVGPSAARRKQRSSASPHDSGSEDPYEFVVDPYSFEEAELNARDAAADKRKEPPKGKVESMKKRK